VTAAAFHVGLLKADHPPTRQVLLSLPYFDTQKSHDHGILQFVGNDDEGNLVFSVGLETAAAPVIKALRSLVAVSEKNCLKMIFIGTMPTVNIWMKLGGVCSRLFGLKGIGRPLVTYGTRLAFPDIVKLVRQVKEGSDERAI